MSARSNLFCQSNLCCQRSLTFMLTQLMPRAIVVLLSISALGLWSAPAPAAEWKKITENSVKDGFFIDTESIQRKGNTVTYWEYREFPEPNNAFLENPVNEPLHGVVIRWSADCTSKTQRLRRVNAFGKERKLLQRFDYGENGTLMQPRPGSSGYEVLEYACNPKPETVKSPAPSPSPSPSTSPSPKS
ncbi:MAG: surface-adhesin E family protein [Synechococcales bacterium]|nr:surface-adhesin E family protein [Synechococcales bacterium]